MTSGLGRSAQVAFWPGSLHLEFDKEIVPCPPAAKLLAIHVHWDSQEAHTECDATKGEHDLLGPFGGNPIVGEVGETVEHEILDED